MSKIYPTEQSEPSNYTQDTLYTKLRSNQLGCDFLLSLFWAAMSSYRHDTLLRPYPPMYREDEDKQIDEMRTVFNTLPSIHKILDKNAAMTARQTDLLQWVITPKAFTLCYKPISTIDHILSQSKLPITRAPSTKPQYVFEVVYSKEVETNFQSVVGSHGVFFAFHGSSLENFHSIVHNGLLNILNKVSAFGEGTYLSTELGVCLNWSPSGPLWPNSCLPHRASCVAICEVVKHPTVLSKKVQRGNEPNLQNKVPEEYFIVSNDELMRLKYILLYRRDGTRRYTGQSWLCNNIFIVVLLLYVLFIVLIGTLQSATFQRFYRKFMSM